MLAADIPTKFNIPWANEADAEFVQKPIPEGSLIGVQDGRASLEDGFVPLNFEPVAAGGIPPWGKDANGILFTVTAWLRWVQAGGAPPAYDSAFAEKIGGYPNGALLKSVPSGHYWISKADNNPTDPDDGGANWELFPDVLIQIQAGNWALTDTGTQNAPAVTLYPVPASLASIVGAPIRFRIAYTNTVTNPTIRINGNTPVPMINSDGTPIVIGQFARAHQIIEGMLDGDGYFQILSPAKPFTESAPPPAQGILVPGCIYLWPLDTPMPGTLECDGSLHNIADYPRLVNVIGQKYGSTNADNFRVPDYRGLFMRGWDHGRGKDKNPSTRTNRGDGTTGDHNGTNQAASVDLTTVDETWVALKNAYSRSSYSTNYWDLWNVDGIDPAFGMSLTNGSRGSGNGATFMAFAATKFPLYHGNDPPPRPAGITDGSGVPYGEVSYIEALLSFKDNIGGAETRPVNINIMYCIAY